MDISSFPTEILDLIVAHLRAVELPWPADIRQIANARLVCRRWNYLATSHLHHSLILGHHDTLVSSWDARLDIPEARNAVHRVTILSAPAATLRWWDGMWSDWIGTTTYTAFTKSITRIAELPNLRELDIRFHQWCSGTCTLINTGTDWHADPELPERRRDNTLTAVFRAIQNRATQIPLATTVQSLTLTNPQNMPLPALIASDLFKDVVAHVDSLHLLTTEDNNGLVTYDLVRTIERQEYEHHLQHTLLPSLVDQLTSLTLAFYERWGLLPAYFNPSDLVLPRLRTLTLTEFVIGRRGHFDWVLAQTSLSTLRLDRCYIASHIHLPRRDVQTWEVSTDDWDRQPRGSYGFTSRDHDVYTFAGTWATIFSQIRERLTNLQDFRLENDKPQFWFRVHGIKGARLSNRRYIACDAGRFPSPWLQADWDGEMEFGNNDPDPVVLDPGGRPWYVKMSLNRAEENEKTDGEALDALMRVIRGRWRSL